MIFLLNEVFPFSFPALNHSHPRNLFIFLLSFAWTKSFLLPSSSCFYSLSSFFSHCKPTCMRSFPYRIEFDDCPFPTCTFSFPLGRPFFRLTNTFSQRRKFLKKQGCNPSSMETHGETQEPHQEPSPSPSSSSSSLSSCCMARAIIPLSFSPIQDVDWHHVLENNGGEDLLPGSAADERIIQFIDIEWKEVEKRFNRLAATSKGPEKAVKCSDFGLCIGLQQSPEFANELLRALRGRSSGDLNRSDMILKRELHGYWHRLADPCFDSRTKIFFDICDRDMDGQINEMDIKQAILLSASTNKLSLTHDQAQEHAGFIMEVLDREGRGYIEPHQLVTLFKLRLPKGSFAPAYHYNDGACHEAPMSTAETLFRFYWRRAWIILFWLTVCVSLFTWKFIQYSHRTAFEVMGYCLCTAKGAAETLKFNMALILLPACRNTITWLRRNRTINYAVPFNDNINFHKLIAGGIVVGVILHGGTHLACDFPRISGSDSLVFRQTIAERFGYHQPSYIQILATTEVASGIAMVILMSIAFLLATKWPRRQSTSLPRSVRNVTGYNTFWYSHHLFILVYALLVVHSMLLFLTSNLIEKTTWMYIAFPVVLYTGERIVRAVRSGFYEVKILKASIYPGKVLSLKLQKPEGFKYKSGMYIFVQCPQISPLQWHPFSLTSGPEDDHLSVHIRSLGDWSYQIYSIYQEAMLSGNKDYPKIFIDGPYGAASQDHVKYDIVLLIGLGIGATPFISILKDVENGLQKSHFAQANNEDCCSISKDPLKGYFYWVTREQSSFDWFRETFREISKANQKQSIIEMHNYLTSVHQEGDARSALISAIQALYRAKNGIDFISRTQVHTHFARPNWFSIFSKLAARHRGERIGVFYCGPTALAKELEGLCASFSSKTTTRFVFHKESY